MECHQRGEDGGGGVGVAGGREEMREWKWRAQRVENNAGPRVN